MKYRIEQGYRVNWKEEKPVAFSFCLFQDRERDIMYKREWRKKSEGNLAASIIIALLDLQAQLEKYLEVLQDQYRQYICICVVKGKVFNNLPMLHYCIEKAYEGPVKGPSAAEQRQYRKG